MKCVAVDRSLTLVFVVALGLMGLFATGFAQQAGTRGAGAQGTGQSSRPATTQPHATQPSEPPAERGGRIDVWGRRFGGERLQAHR